MRIIHALIGNADPNTLNGVNKVVHHLATEQMRDGHEVEVWAIVGDPRDITHTPLYTIRPFKSFYARVFPEGELLSALDNEDSASTIFHIHSVFLPEFWTLTRLLRYRGLAWVQSPHGGYADEALRRGSRVKRLYFNAIETSVPRQSNGLHALGDSETAALKKLAPSVPVAVIPNGQRPLDRLLSEAGRGTSRPIFSYCGRLDRNHKGLDRLVDGFAEYVAAGGKGSLWLIGDGPDRHWLENRATINVAADRIMFLGARTGEDKVEQLSASDVYIQVSRWEGLPMGVLEAAALGLPLLVTEATNMGAEIRRHKAGIVLDAGDVSAVASGLRAMEIAWRDGNARLWGENAANMIERDYSWRNVSRRHVDELYRPALRQRT